MSAATEKFRIAFSLAELDSMLQLAQLSPDWMMENLELISKVEKAKRKAEFGLLTPAFAATKTSATTQRIGVIAAGIQKSRCEELAAKKAAGEKLSQIELEELVTYKADNHESLDEEEQQALNNLMMKKLFQ